MICIERDEEIYKRQQFHLPCRFHRLKLLHKPLQSFLAQYEAKDEKSIFWLDYTNLEIGHFDDFMGLLGKVGADSIIKITLSCDPRDYRKPERLKLLERNSKHNYQMRLTHRPADSTSSHS